MKKTAYFIAGIFLYIGMSLLFSSYGNLVAHRNINKGIIEKFKTKYLGSTPSGKFKNYEFLWNSSAGYEGSAVTKRGKLSIDEEKKSFSAEQWIVEGGFSADEPELQASLRHFYDPTVPNPDERYLQDHLGVIIRKEIPTFNPKINHIDWAISEAEHLYNWKIGKAKLKQALETNDVKERHRLMAYAWRSLGETLHMIADMGCPAHVRDDAHPGLFDDSENESLKEWGNSDPYECICEQLTDHMIGWSEGMVDTDLKDLCEGAHTIRQIAEGLAIYTNKNYFTDQTISGRNVIPRIHPEKTYPSPKLEQCSYNSSTFSYVKTISGHDVIMCRDKTYALGDTHAKRGDPYIDRFCTESQAAALMPQIAEAGANAFRLFIPKLEVKIEELTQKSIKGSVKHTKDEEYINEIFYNGDVELFNSNTGSMVGVIECKDGKFDESISIKGKDIDWNTEGLVAQIQFGGVKVKSQKATAGERQFDPPLLNFKLHTGKSGSHTIAYARVYNAEEYYLGDTTKFPGRLKWDNLSFSANFIDTIPNEPGVLITLSAEISGKIADDFSKIEYFTGTTTYTVKTPPYGGHRSFSELHIKDFLIDPVYIYSGNRSGSDLNNSITYAYAKYEEFDEEGVVIANNSWDENFPDLNDPNFMFEFWFGYFK